MVCRGCKLPHESRRFGFSFIVRNELIYSVGEADDFRRDVVDEHGAVDAACIQIFEEGFGRSAELDDLVEVRPVLLHQFQRMGLEHLHRLDVDVAVSDHA